MLYIPKKVRFEGGWKIMYGDEVLKTFKREELANMYLMDSVFQDLSEQDKVISFKTAIVKRPIKHVETGKIYSSIKECADNFSFNYESFRKKLRRDGKDITYNGQHFECV